jgi:hypothetical protein
MKGGLYILFASMFIVMSGYGLTLPVLPFFIERMALGNGATSEEISVHVGALTGVFALMQFFFAPLWAFKALPPVSANSPGLSRGGFYSFGQSTHRLYLLRSLCWLPQFFWRQKFFGKEGGRMVRILTEVSVKLKIA